MRVARAQSEAVLAELLELAPSGLEEVDVDSSTVEYALYGAIGDLPEPHVLRAAAGDALVELTTTEVADDWSERWREFHRPLVLGRRLSVRPPWEAPQDTELELVIDPGQAFGTGAHATTRLCLELLLDLDAPLGVDSTRASRGDDGPACVDLGCGSGVLAIAAAKLGWPSVLALDYDPLCLEATADNAAVNGVALAGIQRFDLRTEVVPPAELVLANLLAPLLLAWAERMRSAPRADGSPRPRQIIASGLLSSEAAAVSGAFSRCGYRELRRLDLGDWAAIWLSAAPVANLES